MSAVPGTALAAAAAWLQPALLLAVALRVAAGEADAPWLALAALVAPLVALLAPARGPARATPPVAAVAGVVVALVLAADLLLAADTATLLGGARWQGVALAALPVLLVPAWASARRAAPRALAAAVAALLLAAAAVGVALGVAPWTAWTRTSARPALTFSARSGWTVDGERFARAVTLRVGEGQRITALSAGVYRVVEHDTARPTVREWRLGAGDALTLRPGDELDVEAGARLRFEAGRRVPGAPASGIAWADPPGRGPRMLPAALGAVVTLVGGALALVAAPARGRAAAAGPLALLAAVRAALAWGVYGATVPELALGGALSAPLLRLPPLALGPRAGAALAVAAALAPVLLLATGAAALRERLAGAASAAVELWVAVVVAAGALALWPLDPWRVLLVGLGLAAAAWAPARLAASPAGALAGALTGGAAFVALSALPALAPQAPAWLDALTRYPALVAMPLAWLAARVPDAPGEREEPGAAG